MKVLILTALFPPDQDATAQYIKELTSRLSITDEITVLHYGRLPESVEDVRFVSIDKRLSTWRRLWHFTWALVREAKKVDVVYAVNGLSVEFAIAVATGMIKKPIILHLVDEPAAKRAHEHGRKAIHKRALSAAVEVIASENLSEHTPTQTLPALAPTPEINPLETYPESLLTEYASSWDAHVVAIRKILNHVKT